MLVLCPGLAPASDKSLPMCKMFQCPRGTDPHNFGSTAKSPSAVAAMNPHLTLLLSRLYDGDLASEHLTDLRKSGLRDETIAAHFIRSVPLSMIPRLLGFDMPGTRSAMLFPYRAASGGFAPLARVKLFPPLLSADGQQIKYLQPKQSAPRLYFCVPALSEVVSGPAPLWLVEGEKKALAVAQRGLPAVGFAGIEAWHIGGSRELLADFDAIPLADRVVELVPDGDWQTNPNVERGVIRLAQALRARGARPRLVVLPTALEAEA